MHGPLGRTITFIITFLLLLVLPWWVSVVLLAGLTIYFPTYGEVLVFGFLFDTLYASSFRFPYEGLIVATIFLGVVMFVKTRIRT